MPQTKPQPEVAETNTQVAHTIPTPFPTSTRIVKVKPAAKISLLHKSWFWCVIVPFIICCGYFGLIASDRYVGEAKVIVKQADNNSTADFGIALLGTAMSSGKQDAQLVRQFILSLDMLHYLNKSLSVRDHYQSKDVDHLSRLWEWESQEDFLNYYRQHITVNYDELSGVLAIRAQAFTPEFAQKIVKAVLQQSEQYINQIGHQLASEQVNFVEKELDRATQHLRKSKQQILEFQEEYQLFSPEQESGAKLTMVNELEAQLTRHKAELNNLRSYMNDSAADVVALKAKIGSLENQLLIERAKLVGDKSNTFSDVNAKHADLLLDLGFATDLYKASLMSLEQARIEAYRKLKYLVVVDSPSLAEEAEFPKRIYNLVSILVVLSLLYGAMKITWATIKEHRDV
jgi:capsular polysaccharide transport system permease protein